MNERIRELSEQAEKYADDNFRGEPTWSEAFESKFAELIVRECVKVMYDNAIERKVPPNINQTPTHYAIAVLEHFGVEDTNTQLRNRSTYFGHDL
jgi:hypothetical protein